jgi:hypothetical protein
MSASLRPHRGGTEFAVGVIGLAFSLALFGACSAPRSLSQPEPAQADPVETPSVPMDLAGVEITLVRTECGSGYCPNYTVVIDGTGRVSAHEGGPI